MNRVLTALLMVATVAVLGGVVYLLTHNPTVPEAGQTPGYTPSAGLPTSAVASGSSSGSSTPAPTGSASFSSSADAASSTLIAFVGDDYTHGVGSSGPATTFPQLVSAALKVPVKTFYSDDAGYAKAGSSGQAYADLVSAVVAAHPSIVVVSGGRNDRADDPNTLTSKAAALFAALRAGLPAAKIVAVAPWWGDSAHPAVLGQVDTAVSAGVVAAGGTYLDIADPLFNHPEWMANDADPDDQGYAAIAQSLEPKLQPLLQG